MQDMLLAPALDKGTLCMNPRYNRPQGLGSCKEAIDSIVTGIPAAERLVSSVAKHAHGITMIHVSHLEPHFRLADLLARLNQGFQGRIFRGRGYLAATGE